MNKKYAIFDLDGTLADSMVFWKNLAGEYLTGKGITSIPPEFLEQIQAMTMSESVALFAQEFGLSGDPESEMNAMMDAHYCNDIPLKAGALEYLQMLHHNNVQMCVASATAEHLMQACLKRLGILDYFQFVLSCETVGAGKTRPDVYHTCAVRFAALPPEIAVFEDALYAVRTAKSAGYYVVGVYDESEEANWAEVRQIADETIHDWNNP